MMLTYFLTNTKRMNSFDQLLIAYAASAQFADSVLRLVYPKKNGESGAESILKMVKYLENSIGIVPRSIGQIPGKA